jgi:phosphoserine aminotransferase
MGDTGVAAIIPFYLTDFMWPHVKDMIQTIVDKAHGEMTLDTVKAKLKEDRALMITILDNETVKGLAIFQTEIFDTGKKVLVLSMAAGEMSFFSGKYDNVMIGLAKDLKCDEIRALGARMGWTKALKKAETNWEPLSTTLIYKLEK